MQIVISNALRQLKLENKKAINYSIV
jgi:hypothetical protein